ncbi:MAG: hypothetical protein JXR31_06345 [Prolixibacteraceae bacterium]|nr:hypothetical protein [Prolixibacteraceae bacterium]MBN2773850.1 hypothetical protein [Prolixibacteraceae bacterium]
MSSEIQKFLVRISLVAIGLIVPGFVVFKWFFPEYYLPVYWIALVFFYIFTLLIHAWQVNTARKDMAKFTRLNMVTAFLKLMVYAAFVVIYLAISTEKAVAFVIIIMIIYIAFTFTEVNSLTRFTRSLNRKWEK